MDAQPTIWHMERASALLIVLIVLASAGCGPRVFEDPEAYLAFVDADPSFVEEAPGRVFDLTARYRPPASFAANYMAAGVSTEEVREVLADFEQGIHFTLTVAPTDGELDPVYHRPSHDAQGGYAAWLNKLLFGLDEHFTLSAPTVQDIPVGAYQFDRSFGLTKARTFSLAFPATFDGVDLRSERAWTLTVEEFGLGTGTVAFTFKRPFSSAALSLPGSAEGPPLPSDTQASAPVVPTGLAPALLPADS